MYFTEVEKTISQIGEIHRKGVCVFRLDCSLDGNCVKKNKGVFVKMCDILGGWEIILKLGKHFERCCVPEGQPYDED